MAGEWKIAQLTTTATLCLLLFAAALHINYQGTKIEQLEARETAAPDPYFIVPHARIRTTGAQIAVFPYAFANCSFDGPTCAFHGMSDPVEYAVSCTLPRVESCTIAAEYEVSKSKDALPPLPVCLLMTVAAGLMGFFIYRFVEWARCHENCACSACKEAADVAKKEKEARDRAEEDATIDKAFISILNDELVYYCVNYIVIKYTKYRGLSIYDVVRAFFIPDHPEPKIAAGLRRIPEPAKDPKAKPRIPPAECLQLSFRTWTSTHFNVRGTWIQLTPRVKVRRTRTGALYISVDDQPAAKFVPAMNLVIEK